MLRRSTGTLNGVFADKNATAIVYFSTTTYKMSRINGLRVEVGHGYPRASYLEEMVYCNGGFAFSLVPRPKYTPAVSGILRIHSLRSGKLGWGDDCNGIRNSSFACAENNDTQTASFRFTPIVQ